MPHKTFFAFILPSLVAMLLFIALPIVSVVVQSFHVEHARVLVEVESCQPFGGCTTETRVDTEAMEQLRAAQPMGQFNGLGTYLNRGHLAVSEIGAILSSNSGLGDIVSRIYNLPFYKALLFTLVFCF
ncbi:MAG TPA: sugar ABC transporter permease, partial [Devosia sp.]|nr:sugar ABC transporter permease [Devosia sp.]